MMNNLEERIKKIIAGVLEVSESEIDDETAIGDLPSWDSLHHLQIVMKIEKKFGIKFTPEVMVDLEDVEDIVEAVKARTE